MGCVHDDVCIFDSVHCFEFGMVDFNDKNLL